MSQVASNLPQAEEHPLGLRQSFSERLELVSQGRGQPIAENRVVLLYEGQLGFPLVGVDGKQLLHVGGRDVEVVAGYGAVGRQAADGRVDRMTGARAALEDPLEDPAVFTEAR